MRNVPNDHALVVTMGPTDGAPRAPGPPQRPTMSPMNLPAIRGSNMLVVAVKWVTREILWSLDMFARFLITTMVFQGLKHLFSQWFFPKELWEKSPDLIRGFDPVARAKTVNGHEVDDDEEEEGHDDGPMSSEAWAKGTGTQPHFLFSDYDGQTTWKFWSHHVQWHGQRWPCPLLKPTPCDRCQWLVLADRNGEDTPVCIARAKVCPHTRHSSRPHGSGSGPSS